MSRIAIRRFLVLALGGALGLALAALPAAGQAKPPEPLQVQETNEANVVAELVECKRKEGVLTVRVRFRNTGTERARPELVHNSTYDGWYVTAEDKKYFVLRDEERTPLAVPVDTVGNVSPYLKKGGIFLWWAKYPAPPLEVKKVNYITPLTAPFEDIPITDQ